MNTRVQAMLQAIKEAPAGQKHIVFFDEYVKRAGIRTVIRQTDSGRTLFLEKPCEVCGLNHNVQCYVDETEHPASLKEVSRLFKGLSKCPTVH